jgi:hypothetical protein
VTFGLSHFETNIFQVSESARGARGSMRRLGLWLRCRVLMLDGQRSIVGRNFSVMLPGNRIASPIRAFVEHSCPLNQLFGVGHWTPQKLKLQTQMWAGSCSGQIAFCSNHRVTSMQRPSKGFQFRHDAVRRAEAISKSGIRYFRPGNKPERTSGHF